MEQGNWTPEDHEAKMRSNAEFDAAAAILLGESDYDDFTLGDPAFSRRDLCNLIAQQAFIGALKSNNTDALNVVRATARQLWLPKSA